MTGSPSEDHGRALEGPVPTLRSLLAPWVQNRRDKIACVALHQPPDLYRSKNGRASDNSYLRWTYGDLASNGELLASALAARGLRRGETVTALVYNCVEWAIAYWSCAIAKTTVSPVNPNLLKKPEEIQHVLKVAKTKAIIVRDVASAKELEKAAPEQMKAMKAKFIAGSESVESLPGWENLTDVLASAQFNDNLRIDCEDTSSDDPEDPTMVIFTSGTTSLPKGCAHTQRTMTSCVRSQRMGLNLSPDRACVNHIPISHVFGINYCQSYWGAGCKVVFPSESFSPGPTLKAIHLEQITNVPAVPSMLAPLFDHPDLKTIDRSYLIHAELAGSIIMPDDISECIEKLGVKTAASTYGMTEGVPTVSWPLREGPPPVFKERVSAGRVTPGAHIRICEPGSRDPIPRGEKGELHMGGMHIIREYLGAQEDTLYEDQYGPWIMTGDQAIMEENGQISMLGRYKDLIIRGGENISPGAIEAVLNKNTSLMAQVVGAYDEFAGEVPVAVVKWLSTEKTATHELHDVVVKTCGNTHALDEVIDLKDLGLDDFPKTTSGKIRKVDLAEPLRKYRSKASSSAANGQSSVESSIISIWSRVMGVPTDKLSSDTEVSENVDSLTTMKFRAQVERDHGVSLGVEEILENGTIGSHTKMVSERKGKSSPEKDEALALPRRNGPPSQDDMVHCQSDPKIAQRTQAALEPLLREKGLSWKNDVEDVLTTYDMAQAFLERRRPQSFNHRHAFATSASVSQLQTAMEKAMDAHPMLRSLVGEVDGFGPMHVIIRPSKQWFSLACTADGQVESADQLRQYKIHDPKLDFATAPGPMVRWMIVEIKDTKSAGLILQLNHATFDGFSLPYFLEDLDALLQDPSTTTIPSRLHYKFFADAHYLYKSSSLANMDVAFHTSQLKGLAKDSSSFWPPTPNAGRFHGSDQDWTDENGKPGDPQRRPHLDGLDRPRGVDQVVRRESLPSLSSLRKTHSISAVAAALAACALFNTRVTNTKVAVFGAYEAARSWPFLPSWMASRLPDPIHVNGPTVESVVHRLSIDPEATVGQLLEQISSHQELSPSHAHAPSRAVAEALGPADGAAYKDMLTRQVFNWIPGLAAEADGKSPYQDLKRVQQQSRSDHVLRWTCGLLDQDVFHVGVAWDDSQMRQKEAEAAADGFLNALRWLADEKNWERKVAEYER